MNDFETIWSFRGGDTIKRKGERSVVRLRARDDGGSGAVFYLKRHRQRLGRLKTLRSLLPGKARFAEGIRELYFYRRFRQIGLATAEPVAAGSMRRSLSRLDSFLMTRDHAPLVSLEALLLERPDSFRGPARQSKREAVLLGIARYAVKMHLGGMNHRDFNATHILLDDPDAAAPRVALFDLQRVDVSRVNRLHWPIKSLAEVCFTLPPDIFDDSDRRFLLKAYRANRALLLPERLHYGLIRKKMARIATHTRKRGLAPKMTRMPR
jgi:hypothetical protein